ncbi:hypothetical protein ACOMHN_056320 [Nucella lapillus]
MDKDSGGGGGGGERGGGGGERGGGGGESGGGERGDRTKLPQREGSGGSSGTSGVCSGAMSEASSDSSEAGRQQQTTGGGGGAVGGQLLTLCERGEWVVVEQRLKHLAEKGNIHAGHFGTDPEHGITPLMVAVKENRTVIVEKLLELGAPVNEQAKGSGCYQIRDGGKLVVGWK